MPHILPYGYGLEVNFSIPITLKFSKTHIERIDTDVRRIYFQNSNNTFYLFKESVTLFRTFDIFIGKYKIIANKKVNTDYPFFT